MIRSPVCLAAVLALFAAAAMAAEPAAVAPGGRCLALAEQVAASCPDACSRRHCSARCIPPFADTGRCGTCVEHCDRICNAMDDARRQRCESESTAAGSP